MSKSKKRINNRGVSMMGSLVAVALSFILVMIISTSIARMYSAQRSVDLSSREQRMVEELSLRFESSTACDASLATRNYTPSGSVSLSGINMTVNGLTRALTDGAEIVPGYGWTIRTITLETNTSNALADNVMMDVAGVSTAFKKHAGAIRIALQRTDGAGVTPRDVMIPITFIGDSTNRIVSCGKSAMQQSLCQSMGYIWDSSAAIPVCKPANECTYAGAFSDPAAPGAFTNPMTGTNSCPAGFTARRSGTMTEAYRSSKYGVSARLYETFDCIRCLDSVGNLIPAGVVPALPTFASFVNGDPAAIGGESTYTVAQTNISGACTVTLAAAPPYVVGGTYSVPCAPAATPPSGTDCIGGVSQTFTWTDPGTGDVCSKTITTPTVLNNATLQIIKSGVNSSTGNAYFRCINGSFQTVPEISPAPVCNPPAGGGGCRYC